MRFAEANLFGVYVAPIAPLMVATWLILVPLRWLAARAGLLKWVWHPALFTLGAYICLLSSLVLLAGMLLPYPGRV